MFTVCNILHTSFSGLSVSCVTPLSKKIQEDLYIKTCILVYFD